MKKLADYIQNQLLQRLTDNRDSTTRSEPYRIAYEPDLVPPLHLMRQEGLDVLEEWFRWAEEWSMGFFV